MRSEFFAVKAFHQNGEGFARTRHQFRISERFHQTKEKTWVVNFEASESRSKLRSENQNSAHSRKRKKIPDAFEKSFRRSAPKPTVNLTIISILVGRIFQYNLHHHSYKIEVAECLFEFQIRFRQKKLN